jgi:cytidylate kinase
MKKAPIIALDGYSACGKSTLAKELAQALGLIYVDSGAMYRGVTLYFLQNSIDPKPSPEATSALTSIHLAFRKSSDGLANELWMNGIRVEDEIRGPAVSSMVSPVAAIPEVRHKLIEEQRLMGAQGGLVMDGRDIGTHVFPDADVKIFMTADPLIRAKRRTEELRTKGEHWRLEDVLQNLAERDHIDTTRKDQPLRQADDAVVLDNSNLTRKEQLEWALKLVEQRLRVGD